MPTLGDGARRHMYNMSVIWIVAIVLFGAGAVFLYGFIGWMSDLRDNDETIYDTGWGWLLPGGFFYKLGRGDDSPRERIWPYLFGGFFDGWLYNSAREKRRRELGD